MTVLRDPISGRLTISSEELAAGIVFVVIFVLACMAPSRGDTWWLIRAGQDIWETGRVPVVDSYSHTIMGQPWPNHEWLTDVLFYGVYAAAGMPGLTFFGAALILTATFGSWSMMAGRFELRLSVFVLALLSAAAGWALRPHLTTMVCLVVACRMVLARRLLWLPPLFLLWANLHGGVVLGLIVIGVVVVVDTVRDRRIPLDLVGAGLLSGAATLVTPLGLDLWRLLFTYGEGARGEGIQEWVAPALPPSNLAFWTVVVALVTSIAYRWRSFDAATTRKVGIALALMPFALTAVRHITLFQLLAAPALLAAMSPPVLPRDLPLNNDRRLGNGLLLAGAFLTAVVAVGVIWLQSPERLNWKPLSDATIAAAADCPSPLYNTYDDGGPLIWFVPSKPVFIDSRYDPYPMPLFHENQHLEATGAYQDLFQRYSFRCAIVRTSTPTDTALRTDPVWQVTHSDAKHTVLVRH